MRWIESAAEAVAVDTVTVATEAATDADKVLPLIEAAAVRPARTAGHARTVGQRKRAKVKTIFRNRSSDRSDNPQNP